MPTIASRLSDSPATLAPLSSPSSMQVAAPPIGNSSAVSTTLRSPMPNLSPPSPDNLKQYAFNGLIPQYRITPPGFINAQGGGTNSSSSSSSLTGSITTTGTTTTTISIVGVTSNSQVSITPTNSVAAAMTGVYATPSLNRITITHPATPGGTFSIIVVS